MKKEKNFLKKGKKVLGKEKIHMQKALLLLLLLAGTAGKAQTDFRNYKMAGPYEVVARDGQYRHTKGGSERDMLAAFECAKAALTAPSPSDREAYAAKAMEIADAYADALQHLDGHDAPLCLIQAFDLVRAMTLLEDTTHHARHAALIRRAFVPTIDKFEADSPYANGNWGAIVNRMRMACAIFLNDNDMYRASVDYFLHANDNGSLPNYIAPSGQSQETGRDQAHAQLGLEALAQTAEMAYTQGDDLWGALDNRLLKGFEYCARYNLGNEVPYEQKQDCTGLYCDWTEPGAMSRGKLWDIYELPYYHYVVRKGLKMPYPKKVIALQAKDGKALKRSPKKQEATPPALWHAVGGGASVTQAPGVTETKRLHRMYAYPAPQGAPLKQDYKVYAKALGDAAWTEIDTYMARVNAATPEGGHRVSEISYAFVDFTGNLQVRVITKKRKFRTARIRPDYRGTICNIENDSTINFMLFQPENVSVEFDGDISDNLLFFTSKPPVGKQEAEDEARRQGRSFIYYAPGFYDTPDTLSIPSNTTVYLAPGSYFSGTFSISDAHDVSIIGRGVARPKNGYEGCHVRNSTDVLVEGMVVNTCPVGGSARVTLRDVRSISHPGWGDGLNVFASHDVLFERVFCRNSDDCTTAYATRKGFSGSCRNVTMRNSTLWADVAHPIFIGLHGNSERGDTIENLLYENIDILGQAETQVDYQGCMAINCGDNNIVRNVTFSNIRIEQIQKGSICQVKVGYNQKYCTAPGRGVENVLFRNIRYYGEQPYISILAGYDNERKVRGVTFEGLKTGGKLIHDAMPGKPAWHNTADYVPMYVGNHVENVVFSPDAHTTFLRKALAYCSTQVDSALAALRPYDFTMMPRNILPSGPKDTSRAEMKGENSTNHTLPLRWNLRPACAEEWCSGFWPGILWMTFASNHSEAVKKAAEGYTRAIVPITESPVYDHDLGFIAISSLMKGYEVTHDSSYRLALLRAADSLATLFNPNVGTMLSWPRHVDDYGGHNTIIDNMMNLELLFWAAEHGGSHILKDMAVRHAETTMQHQFRPDGSCYHVAVYDTRSGRFIHGVTHQGYSNQSMWSRGQAWAIYGYTMVYRFTRDTRFLDFAQKTADIYLHRLHATSDDLVPKWDMDSPDGQKDVSAACIAASALIELSQHVGGTKGQQYLDEAEQTLRQLSTSQYQSRDRSHAFLMHSTGHLPAGTEIDASIVYADYYYLEALLRLAKL